MKKSLLMLCAVLLLLCSAPVVMAEIDNANVFVAAVTLFTPRLLVVTVTCKGEPVAGEPVTVERAAPLSDTPLFERAVLTTDENGVAAVITLYGKFLVKVRDQEQVARNTILMGVKRLSFEACQ